MARDQGCSPYAVSVGLLIGIFIGREDSQEPEQSYEESCCNQHNSTGWQDTSRLREPLPAPRTPLQYRLLASVIAQQLQAIDGAEEKTLGDLQDEIRAAFTTGNFGRDVADRLGKRLARVRSLDDLLDLAAHLGQLLKPAQESWTVHGRERPMTLKANSVFGVFLRRVAAACDGASFSRLSLLYEDVLRYTSSLRGDEPLNKKQKQDEDTRSLNAAFEDSHASDDVMMDLGSPTVPSGGGFAEFGGFSGRSGTGTGGGGGGHIDAFIQKQSLNASSPFPPQSAGRISKSSGGGGDGRREAQGGGGFSRSVTAWQLQRRLQKKVTKLENGMSSQVSFEEVEKEVQAALAAHSDVPKAHFLRLMNCMHHRDMEGSLDSLHRYFDYAVRRGGPSNATAETFLDLAKGPQGGSGRHNPQHASLGLVRLHFEFGHLGLASLALGEAIRVAQQSGDKACVAQAMGWLYHVLAAQGHPRAGDVLRRCASQSADLGLYHLMYSAALSLAREAAMAKNGSDPSEAVDQSSSSIAMGVRGVAQRRASPTRVWECLAAAASGDVRGLLESEAGNGAGLLDNMAVSGTRGRPAVERAGGTGGEVEAGLACKRLLVEAGAFERFGYSEMAVACSRSVLQVHGDFATALDVELASACIITAILRGKSLPGLSNAPRLSTPLLPSSGERDRSPPPASGATETPRFISRQEQVAASSTRTGVGEKRRGQGIDSGEEGCVFEAALSVALRQHEAFPHPVSNVWAAGVMVLLHEWMVNRGELTAAEGLGMNLRGCCPISRGAEAFIEAHLQRVRLLRAQGRWTEAVKAASALAKLSDTRALAPQYARLLLELSRARLGAEPGSPIGALPHALRCLAVCESCSLDAIHAAAMTHLAEVHLRMGSTRQARILLRACLGHILANAPCQSQGEACLAMAKCDIAEASLQHQELIERSRSGDGSPGVPGRDGGNDAGEGTGSARRREERRNSLERAVLHLDRAIVLLKRCHDLAGLRECFYLKARVCGEQVAQGGKSSDMAKAERNSAAEAFVAISEAGVRALASPSPGLKIGPAEVERYMSAAMTSVPWRVAMT